MSFLLAIVVATSATIHGDRAIGPVRVGTGTLAQAKVVWGPPTAIRPGPDTCRVRWSWLGLSVSFLAFGTDPCSTGTAVYATATAPAWKTDRGLRVHDPVARLKALYPKAKAAADGYWLVTRHACKEVGGHAFGTLVAKIGRGRVTGFVVSANVCD